MCIVERDHLDQPLDEFLRSKNCELVKAFAANEEDTDTLVAVYTTTTEPKQLNIRVIWDHPYDGYQLTRKGIVVSARDAKDFEKSIRSAIELVLDVTQV